MSAARERLTTATLFLASFAVYAAGAVRTIYVGDSGELVAAVHLLGIPHPSGYPLYVLLGKLWTVLVPAGSIAFRMSLFSAAAAAGTVALVYRIGRALSLSPVAAVFGSLLLAFSPSFWSQANIQRVYSLNALFLAMVMLAAIRWFSNRRDRDLLLAFFLAGLGATNHTFMLIAAIALAITAILVEPRMVLRWRLMVGTVAAFAVGLLPYLFLPLRSRQDPRLDWGNPETWENFRRVVTRAEFWDRRWLEGPGDFPPVLYDWLRGLLTEGAWVAAPLALIAMILALREFRGRIFREENRETRMTASSAATILALGVMCGNLLSMALHGSRSDIFIWHRYYIPSYLMLALLAAIGLHAVLPRLPSWLRLVPLAIPLILLLIHFPRFDRSSYRIAEDYSRTLLRSLPPGAALTASDDNILFVLIYLHLVEGLRPDINLILQGVSEGTPARFEFNPDHDAVFFTHHPNWTLPQLQIVPRGLAFQILRAGTPPPPLQIGKTRLEGEDDPGVPKDYLTQNLIGEFHYMLGVTFERVDWRRARSEFREAVEKAPRNDVLHYNLGLIYGRNGMYHRAAESFRRVHQISPKGMASASERASKARGSTLAEASIEAAERELARLHRIEQTLIASDPQLSSLPPGSAAWHRRMAILLDSASDPLAARGHWLLAEEAEAGS